MSYLPPIYPTVGHLVTIQDSVSRESVPSTHGSPATVHTTFEDVSKMQLESSELHTEVSTTSVQRNNETISSEPLELPQHGASYTTPDSRQAILDEATAEFTQVNHSSQSVANNDTSSVEEQEDAMLAFASQDDLDLGPAPETVPELPEVCPQPMIYDISSQESSTLASVAGLHSSPSLRPTTPAAERVLDTVFLDDHNDLLGLPAPPDVDGRPLVPGVGYSLLRISVTSPVAAPRSPTRPVTFSSLGPDKLDSVANHAEPTALSRMNELPLNNVVDRITLVEALSKDTDIPYEATSLELEDVPAEPLYIMSPSSPQAELLDFPCSTFDDSCQSDDTNTCLDSALLTSEETSCDNPEDDLGASTIELDGVNFQALNGQNGLPLEENLVIRTASPVSAVANSMDELSRDGIPDCTMAESEDSEDTGEDWTLPPSSQGAFSSSPIPSSSPPKIFSSSPPEWANLCTPPSSSPPTSDITKFQQDEVASLNGTPSGVLEDCSLQLENDLKDENDDNPVIKRAKLKLDSTLLSPPRPPNPKRQTIASQKKQYKKLATAFRSPLIDSGSPLLRKDGVYSNGRSSSGSPSTTGVHRDTDVKTDDTIFRDTQSDQKDYTNSAAKQFKSPLMQRLSSGNSSATYHTSSTDKGGHPVNMQTLMAQVQKLKQAIKIKENISGGPGDKLEDLVKKWTRVGREVAWEVWDYVKDNEVDQGAGGWANENGAFGGQKRPFDGWGEEGGDKKRVKYKYDGWEWDGDEKGDAQEGQGMDVDEEAQALNHTLGTMLRFMGIAPETLGWDEGEGDFVGEV
ncbi:hypothetical protein BXZ70DRAFT_427966 [Cristinia sonorae]|uniref:Uncharacterized protein n=1 Tax=Cristinia sonorae TaxID=1940300 RepID=A0A8K0UWJ0_9AGAR|nr:hypothetical protein BXZ70DRAFT_427966 [Cristinia sonorae]